MTGGRSPAQKGREWRTLDWLPGYEMSENGEIWNGFKVIAGHFCQGYHCAKLTTPQGGKRIYRVHRLVCEAFHGPAPEGRPEVAHNDGERANNHFSNLRWASRLENNSDRYDHGTSVAGEGNPRNVLSYEQVCEIRAKFSGVRGEKSALARDYGVSISCIARILSGKNWPTTTFKNGQPVKKAKVSSKGRYVKGRSYEYELRDSFIAAGFKCRRVIQSGGGTEKDDLVLMTPWGEEYRIEAKRRAKLPGYLLNPTCHATIFRPDRGDSMVLITFERFLELIQCQ